APSSRHALRSVDLVVIGRGTSVTERSTVAGERLLRLSCPDARISSTHARIRHAVGRWIVEDAGSRNGTLVNGDPVRTAALRDGDTIELGRTFFLFRSSAGGEGPLDVDAVAG